MIDVLSDFSARPRRSLRELAAAAHALDTLHGEAEVCGICDDSRHVQNGDAFLCVPRALDKAQEFAEQAAERGASCIISVGLRGLEVTIPHLPLADMQAAGSLLRRWFGTEASSVRLFGITGTDGKTSVTWMLSEALRRRFGKVWSVGTLGWIRDGGEVVEIGNTTPSLLMLHGLLCAAVQADVKAMVCEVSSHGIVQQRIAGLPFSHAAWTTLGHDHLQDHGGFKTYAAIKASFIEAVAVGGGCVVGNADDAGVAQRLPAGALRFGRGLFRDDIDLAWEQELPGMLRLCQPSNAGKTAEHGSEVYVGDIPVGNFHAENMACTALLLLQNGLSIHELPALLDGISAPPGRMQAMNIGRWQVFIDYAHTPEALACALQAARQFTEDRLMLVFGCGGERDREKRPQMGEIATRLADVVWLTSDNSRGELPEVIVSEIEAGMPHPYPAEVHLKLDRAQAIDAAIADMQCGDVLLIAGKGHESYIDIGGQRTPWSDAEAAAKALHAKSDTMEFRACA
ncbi:MAG: UDP-N-acetylmuramoyl-L-alanyl-D-glutamate--2,6-diaminopimelate ligase [Mariprofundaceae bacterium]|nr:UDP-N-acetylmuramoyl-L-alanyl-D-glutamate--2,6-diaminopimelate ligase [Mariprofundaceae bacterium]